MADAHSPLEPPVNTDLASSTAHDPLSRRDEDLLTMKREIDALQVAVLKESTPWYRNVSTLISALALLFSFSTTYVSFRRADAQDVQTRRQELRNLLQRLSELPKENLDLTKKYADDPAARSVALGFVNQENAIVVRQAVEIARSLPKEQVTATDYYALASALQASYELDRALEFLNLSLDNAKDFGTEIAAVRGRANLYFLTGRFGDGRVDYQRALTIFDKYKGFDPYTRATTNVYTEISWALSEANTNQFAQALQHLDSADRIVADLPPSPGADALKAQVSQTRANIARGTAASRPAAAAALVAPPPQ